jgi:hypothetical protein
VEHVVFYPAHDGTPAFRRVATLEEAVRLVEHLRNVEGIDEVSCHALTEVPLAFRAYYRVEVPGVVEAPVEAPVEAAAVPLQPVAEELAPAEAVAALPSVVEEPQAAEVVEVVEVAPEPEMAVAASSNGHASDGAKSLGFFA